MSLFSSILAKLGIGTAAAGPAPAPQRTPAPSAERPPAPSVPPARPPPATVDVVAQLEKRAAANPQKLNWRTSIVDLMKLLDMDSSLAERKALAKELGARRNVMDDSAHMNIWLHKEVLKRIAANGGNVPANLLD